MDGKKRSSAVSAFPVPDVSQTNSADKKSSRKKRPAPKGKTDLVSVDEANSAPAPKGLFDILEDTGASSAPAWADEDDSAFAIDLSTVARLRKTRETETETKISSEEFNKRMRKQFTTLNGDASWAALPGERDASTSNAIDAALAGADVDDEDAFDFASAASLTRDILSSSAALTHARTNGHRVTEANLAALPSGRLEIARLPDATVASMHASIITSCRFHADGELLLTSGLDSMLKLFHVDSARNPLVQGVKIRDLPIRCADFIGTSEVMATGRRNYFYTYDLVKGATTKVPFVRGREDKEKSLERFRVCADGSKIAVLGTDGNILMLHGRSKQLTATLRAPCHVNDLAFGPASGHELHAACNDGSVLTFDLRMNRALARRQDEGSVHVAAVGASADGKYIAAGSDAGYLNVYAAALEAGDSTGARAKPLKGLDSLTTTVDRVVFSPSCEMLAMSSFRKKDSLRMVHLPSLTVFNNWPTANTPLGYVQDMDFSPTGGMVAVGNDKGKVLLYRLNHYLSN